MENVNTNPAAAGAEAAAPPVVVAPAEANSPAGGDHASQLSQMIDKMLAGMEGKESEAGKEATPTAYTQAQLDALVAERLEVAKAEWEENHKKEDKGDKKPSVEDELAALKTQLLEKDLRAAALVELGKEGFPTGLADNLNYRSEAEMRKSLMDIKANFTKCLSDALQEKLKGKTPPGLGGAQNPMSPNLSPSAKADVLNAHRIVK